MVYNGILMEIIGIYVMFLVGFPLFFLAGASLLKKKLIKNAIEGKFNTSNHWGLMLDLGLVKSLSHCMMDIRLIVMFTLAC